ncbi:SDR family oxidoreductase [Aestuariicella hydrocarbonica]|uniref:SDR family oxidoreductase n=1 Tax=Pseudomaricurvus hydrocarbonicus TaxID=1470433 RepID=A0A9E5MP20_9GAMM|nr:SDR family oxidoreductase [Aestuariicella hydrocarbonica]NHO67806.1 SDR family oxidoreductase [Aestuariicella hydrocarbonica]
MSKVAIITGASSGIGAATAELFHAEGYKVVLAGRNKDRLTAAASNLHDAITWAGDLTSSKACNELIEFTLSHYGRVDVLINCAGVIHRYTAEETTDEHWENTMAVNLNAPFFLSRSAIPHMKTSGGVILNIASDWGLQGGQLAAAYCASKGGLVLMTKAMALDHAKENIRVNAICPGDVDTPMLKVESEQRGMDYQTAMIQNNADSPTGRITLPAEVAALCLYLASDAAAQITGTAIPIDGGNTA